MLYSQTVRLVLESLGREDEIEYYLKRFRSTNSAFFSCIIPDQNTLDSFWEAFLLPIEILYKLELFPLIIITGPRYEQFFNLFQDRNYFHVLMSRDIQSDQNIIRELLHQKEKRIQKVHIIISNSLLIHFIHLFRDVIPKRILFVRNQGFLRNQKKENLFSIAPYRNTRQLLKDSNTFLAKEDIPVYWMVSEIYRMDPQFQISVTSSFLLLRELFTVKGAGTLIREPSIILNVKKEQITIDLQETIKNIIENSFQKPLKEHIWNNISEVFLDSNFQSLIALEEYEFGVYLSKFAVSLEARGRGIAQDLWNEVLKKNYPLFWKTHKKNSIRKWYEKICDGMIRSDPYIIFWKNLSYRDIPRIMDFIIKRGSDFYEYSND